MAQKSQKKSQGFGESPVPTRAAKRFMVAFGKQKGDEKTLFLVANPEKLGESLLEALPLVFKDMAKGEDLDGRCAIAGMFVHFGNLLYEFPRGDRWLNLELAIEAYKLALQVFKQKIFPQEWATAQMNLGVAYRNRIRGDKAENLEWAIAALELCLEVYTREDFPEDWARNQHNLADACRDRVRGNPQQNIERAISHYNQAAEVFTRAAYPHKWFRNQAHLAAAYLARADLSATTPPDKLAGLNVAVTLLQEVLETADSENPTPDYIDTQYNLGTALARRYEHTQNPPDHQSAFEAFKIALDAISPEHYDREKMWQALPETQIILGRCLVRDGEWYKGRELLEAAINQLKPKGDSLTLANAYFQMGQTHELMSHPEEARIFYRDALRYYERVNHEPGIARSHHHLGSILAFRGYLSKAMTEFDKARALYQKLNKTTEVAEIDTLYQAAERGRQKFEETGVTV